MYRIIFSVLLPLLGMLISQPLSAQTTQISPIQAQISPNAADHLAVYQTWITSLVEGNFTRAKESMAPEFKANGKEGEYINRDGFLAMWEGYHQSAHDNSGSFNTLALKVDEGQYQGEWVLAWGTTSWTLNGAEEAIQSEQHQVVKIEDGKVAMLYNYQDALPILLKMGFSVSPPAAAHSGK